MDASGSFAELVKDCLEFDAEGGHINCSSPLDFSQLELMFPEQDEQSVLRMKVVAGFYILICVVGLVTNIGLLVSLFLGGKQGATYRAPSTILIANLGKF